MNKIVTLPVLIGIAVSCVMAHAQNAPAQLGDSSRITDWIVKDVCVDSENRPVPLDPYYECPAGITRRKIQPGDPLPYYNFDQTGHQEGEAIALLDAEGNPLYLHAVEHPPFNEYHVNGDFSSDSVGADGYDSYSLDSRWFSVAGTRDPGGYGQEFFGADCRLGDGWILLPTYGFLTGGSARAPISERYWEQSGMSYPGECPSRYNNPPITFWELKKNMQFPGARGNSPKTMDAMVVYQGFYKYGQRNHMEIFWFTQQYGLTMWMSWEPLLSHEGAELRSDSVIQTDGIVNFQGVDFRIHGFRDWSNVQLATKASIPDWPMPEANLLQHSHFDDGGGYLKGPEDTFGLWHRSGLSGEGRLIDWSLRNSTTRRDTKFNQRGVRYMVVDSAGSPTGPTVQEIRQELPINRIAPNGTYLFGVEARTESGEGTLQVTIQELDANNHVLWYDYVRGTVNPTNGYNSPPEDFSVYHTSAFIHKVTVIPAREGAVKIRFYFTPLTGETFDILDSWLNRFPALRGPLGAAP